MRTLWNVRREVRKEEVEVFLGVIITFLKNTHGVAGVCVPVDRRRDLVERLDAYRCYGDVAGLELVEELAHMWGGMCFWGTSATIVISHAEAAFCVASAYFAGGEELDAGGYVIDMLLDVGRDVISAGS